MVRENSQAATRAGSKLRYYVVTINLDRCVVVGGIMTESILCSIVSLKEIQRVTAVGAVPSVRNASGGSFSEQAAR